MFSNRSEDSHVQNSSFDWILDNQIKVSEDGLLFHSLSYFYNNTFIGTILLRKHPKQEIFELQSIYFSTVDRFIPLISHHAPHSKLINFYVNAIQTNTYNPDIFKKHAYNYFEGPLTDYLDFELGHGLIISDLDTDEQKLGFGLFAKKLFPILKKEGIQYSLSSSDYIDNAWLRDFNICMGNGVQIIHPENTLDKANFKLAKSIISLDQNGFYSSDWPKSLNPGLCIGGASTSYDEYEMRSSIYDYCVNNDISFIKTDCILEGGNILTTSLNNRTHVIIGRNLIAINAVYRKKINANHIIDINKIRDEYTAKINKNTDHLYYKLDNANYGIDIGHLKEARSAIETALNIAHEKTIWLDNYLFHIDMYLSRGPDNIIFIHNNHMTVKVLTKEYQKTNSQQAKDAIMFALLFEHKSGNILKQNKHKLEKHGFRVIDVPGIACIYNQDDTIISTMTNFMNGYSGRGKNGYFHITLPSRFKCMNKKFKRILKANGVDNVYLIGNSKTAEDILVNEGSLRCLSNQASMIFGHLGNTEDPAHVPAEINLEYGEVVYNEEISISSDSDIENPEIEMHAFLDEEEKVENETVHYTNNNNLFFYNENNKENYDFTRNNSLTSSSVVWGKS